jgi:hypothetical protein
MLTSRSHPTFSKTCDITAITAASGRQRARLTVVNVKSRQYMVKILGMWKRIDRANLRSTVTRAWHKSRTTDGDMHCRLRIRL